MSNPSASYTKLLHTENQEAERLQLSERTLQQWRRRGNGPPYIKLGSAVRYDPALTDEWLARNTVSSTSQKAG